MNIQEYNAKFNEKVVGSLSVVEDDVDTLQEDIEGVDTRVTVLENEYLNVLSNGHLDYYTSENLPTLPYNTAYSKSVEYQDEIHILGGNGNKVGHYRLDKNSNEWVKLNDLPYDFTNGITVIYQDEIHILSSDANTQYYSYHYKWNSTTDTWASASTLPNSMCWTTGTVYLDRIYITGAYGNGSYNSYVYHWNGTTWAKMTNNVPYANAYGLLLNVDGVLHMLGGYDSTNQKKHYKLANGAWILVGDLPVGIYQKVADVKDGKIFLFYSKYRYVWDGYTWGEYSNTNMSTDYGTSVVHNDDIYMIKGNSYQKLVYGDFIYGYAKANTKIYLPIESKARTSNLEVIEDGYKVTEDGYVEILLK